MSEIIVSWVASLSLGFCLQNGLIHTVMKIGDNTRPIEEA